MTKRKAIPCQMKIQSLLHFGIIRCQECTLAITATQPIEWDHIAALIHDGMNAYWNLRPLHVECHKKKTARDIKANAKVKRLARGIKRPSRPMPGSRASDLKKKMDGTVERR